MKNYELKTEVKALYKGNWWLAFQNYILPNIVAGIGMFVILIVLMMISMMFMANSKSLVMQLIGIIIMFGGFIITILCAISILFVPYYRYMDWLRTGEMGPLSFSDVINKKYYKGTLAITLLAILFSCLWGLLFLIPGIVKSYSYSAAIFIYKDKVDAGEENISYLGCITESRSLMKGNKGHLFILQLSMLGWVLLNAVTSGLAGLWTIPYMVMTFVNFYRYLLDNDSKKQAITG